MPAHGIHSRNRVSLLQIGSIEGRIGGTHTGRENYVYRDVVLSPLVGKGPRQSSNRLLRSVVCSTIPTTVYAVDRCEVDDTPGSDSAEEGQCRLARPPRAAQSGTQGLIHV